MRVGLTLTFAFAAGTDVITNGMAGGQERIRGKVLSFDGTRYTVEATGRDGHKITLHPTHKNLEAADPEVLRAEQRKRARHLFENQQCCTDFL